VHQYHTIRSEVSLGYILKNPKSVDKMAEYSVRRKRIFPDFQLSGQI
jgi:hypothetical protein